MPPLNQLASPLDSVTDVILGLGFTVHDQDIDDRFVSFELPNRFGKPLSSLAVFREDAGLLHISVQVMKMALPSFMAAELNEFLNLFNLRFIPAVLTISTDSDGDDEIEIVVSQFLVEGLDVEAVSKRILQHLNESLNASLPALHEFLFQKIIYRIDTDGEIKHLRISKDAKNCFAMVRQGIYGTA